MTWVPRSSPFNLGIESYALTFAANDNGSVVVAFGTRQQSIHNSTVLLRSTDHGETWAAASSTPSFDSFFQLTPYRTLIWDTDNQLFVICTAYQTGAGFRVATSPDGDVWTQRYQQVDSCAYMIGAAMRAPSLGLTTILMGIDITTGYCITSPDDVNWTNHGTCPVTAPTALAWSDPLGLGIALGNSGGDYFTTTDGINFTPVTDGGVNFGFGGIIWSDTWQAFFATAQDATTFEMLVAKSTDGANWTVVLRNGNNNIGVVGELVGGGLLTTAGFMQGFTSIGGFLSSDGGSSWSNSPFIPGYSSPNVVANDTVTNYLGFQPQDTSQVAIQTGTPIRNARPRGRVAPLWRYFISDLDGFGITDYSKLASGRTVEVTLNAPLSVSGTVPSDNPQVWTPYDVDTFDDPYLNEGTRLLWAFRRESNTPPYYTIRASTIVQLVQDAAQQDDARTTFQGWDPWHYLMSRPVCNSSGGLPGERGLSFTNTQASVVIGSLLKWSIDNMGHAYVDAGEDYSGTFYWDGELETGAGMEIDINFQQGTSVGQAWQQVTDMGVCDIILDPIYDPGNRPNYLCQLNVYAQAGVTRDEQIFAWNMPGRSLVGLDRQEDGSSRANNVQFYAGPGGVYGAGVLQTDTDSEDKYGEYWSQQFFPAQIPRQAVTSLAAQQLELRKNGRETVTFRPAPERSPRPWQDYQLGDRVPVYASPSKFRKALGTHTVGTFTETAYQRIFGWRANLSDDALETIDPVLTSPETGA